MKINPEAQLAVKLYERMFQKRRAEGVPVHVITGAITTDSFTVCRDAAKLCSVARALRRIYETKCNRSLTVKEINREKKLAQAISEIIGSYGLQADVNNDPRGYSVYLHFPDGSYNSWGGPETGWGI